jgi:hypothetical protein
VFATCLFCSAPFGHNDVVEPMPVGRRLAFDAERGRLWVVCRGCERWNLTPLEERWEAIEQCERMFRGTRVRVSTDNIGLAKLPEGLELVRIGRPLRPEFAAWRYGDQFGRRRRRAIAGATVGAAAAMVAAPVALPAAATVIWGPTLMVSGWLSAGAQLPYQMAKDWLFSERVVARIPYDGDVLQVRVRHVRESTVHHDGDGLSVRLWHDGGDSILRAERAHRTVGTLLARTNLFGATRRSVQEAVRRIDRRGNADAWLREAAGLSGRPGGRVMGKMRRVGAFMLTDVERLALEMAVHEESERRVLEGELTHLAEAWRGAEEIAAIADRL